MKSLVLLGVGLASIVSGGVLQLTGSDPAISFGSLSNPAVLTAACGVKANASINFIAQNFSVPTGYPEGDEVIAYLMNVPVGCGGVSLRQACVDTAGIRPPLWRCVWSGSEGSKSTGPVKAEARHAPSNPMLRLCPPVSLPPPPHSSTGARVRSVAAAHGHFDHKRI